MKRIIVLTLSLTMIVSMLVIAAMPASAQVHNPYGVTSVGCITDIDVKSTTELLGGVEYFNSVVTSHIQGLDNSAAIPYRVYGAIGNTDSRMFVYSIGTEDGLDYARATTKAIVERFEAENPGWDAVAAVNGDFFDIETENTDSTGEPEFPMIQGGDVYKSLALSSATGRGVIGVTDSGEMIYYTAGEKYVENGYGKQFRISEDYMLQVLGEHRTNAIAEYPADADAKLQDHNVIFVTPYSDARSLSGATVYVVKCDTYRRSHVGINGNELGTTGYFIEGEIVEIRKGGYDEKAPEGYVYFALKQPEYFDLLTVGTYVKCQKVLTGAWENVTEAVGFKQQLLANGNLLLKNAYGNYNKNADLSATREWTEDIYDYPYCWKHRTAIGFKADGSAVLLVLEKSHTDGTYKNLGASYYEIAEQLKALGCTNGFLLDGGGSSTFVVRNEDGSFSDKFIGEGNGRPVANVVILAVRDESVPLPELDEEVEVVLPVEKQTERKTQKATEPPVAQTELATEQNESDNEAVNKGCGASMAMPALLSAFAATSALCVNKKRKRR